MSSLSYLASSLLPMVAVRSGKASSSWIYLVSFEGWKATVPLGLLTSGTFMSMACCARFATSRSLFFSAAMTRD